MTTICIEGMDCSGKSTVCKLLLEWNVAQGHRHRKMAPKSAMEAFREARRNHAWDSIEVTRALVEAIEYDIDHAERDPEDFLTIQESTLLYKGYAMLAASGVSPSILGEFDGVWERHPRFDAYFYLTVSKQARLQRLRKREASGEPLTKNDRVMLEDYDRFAHTEEAMMGMLKGRYGATVIDTSHLTPEGIASLIACSVARSDSACRTLPQSLGKCA